MEEKKSIKINFSTTVFIIIIIALIGVIVYFAIQNDELQKAKEQSANEVQNLQVKIGELKTTVNQLREETNSTNEAVNTQQSELEVELYEFLLRKGMLISKDAGMPSSYPPVYYFCYNGNFAYSAIGGYSPRMSGQIIGYRGTWNITNNKLILNIQEELIAEGGKQINEEDDAIEGQHIEDYKKVIYKTNIVKEYKINEYIKYGNDFTTENYFKLDKMELHLLCVADDDSFLEDLKNIAINGYNGLIN